MVKNREKYKSLEDLEHLEKLTQSCYSNVRQIAEKYQNNGLTLKEKICYGNIGVVSAAENYDKTNDNEFPTYANLYIKQSIEQALTECYKIAHSPSNMTCENLVSVPYSKNGNFSDHNNISSKSKTKTTYFKVLEINKNSITTKVLINKEERSFQKRRFDIEPFLQMNLEVNDIVLIITSTIPGQRTFNYHKIKDSSSKFDEIKSLFIKKDYFKNLEISDLFKPLPVENEDNV